MVDKSAEAPTAATAILWERSDVNSAMRQGWGARGAKWAALHVLTWLALQANAATLQVLIDSDSDTTTGCSVSLLAPPGNFAGAEVVLLTMVDTSTTPPHVSEVAQQVCDNATHTLGAPTTVNAGGWSVGVGQGVAGYDAIETVYVPGSLSGRYQLGFTYSDASIGSDSLVAMGGGTPIAFAFGEANGIPGIPTLGQFSLALLAFMVSGVAWQALRRYKAPTMLLVAVMAVVLTTTTWAAITLDGAIADWTGIAPLVSDASGDAPAGSDLTAVFASAESNPQRIFFRADARIASLPSITSGDAASFAVGTAGSFTVTATGLPTPALAQGGATLPNGMTFTDNGNGTGTLAGTPAAGTAGNYALTFVANNAAGASPSQDFALTVNKRQQAISITSPAPVAATVGGTSYTVVATATSGLAVSYAIAPAASAVCSLAGSTVSFIGVGTCTINANQAGDATYDAAAQVQQSFTVLKATQTIGFTSAIPTAATVGGASYGVAATATSGLPVSFAIDTAASSVCTLSGTTVSFLTGGTCVINANQAGNANYNAAIQVQQSFAVAKATQTISFTSPAPTAATVGGATYNVAGTATSGLALSFAIDATASSVCSIAGSTVSFVGAGTCVINANQAGNGAYSAAAQVQQSFAVKSPQTISFTSTAPTAATVGGATYAVAATATSGLAVNFTIDATASSVCSIAGSTISFIGAGTCVVNANQAGSATYNAALQVQQSFTVAKATQTISFTSAAPTAATVGGATYAVAATATSGLAVSFAIDASASSVCSIAGSTVSFIGPGTCVINADQAGNGGYQAAAQVQQSFTVTKAAQAISFSSAAPTLATVAGATYDVAASATSGLPVTLSIDATAASVCSLSATTVSFLAVGTCTINANQAGNTTYMAAPQVQQSFGVKNDQTISFTSTVPTTAEVGGTTYTVSATADSALPVSFTIDAAASGVCSVSGDTVSFDAVGTCIINADQAGNANYHAAPQVQQSFLVKNTQTITFTSTAPTAAMYLDSYAVAATSTSGLTVALAIDAATTSVCSLSGSTVSFNATGTCTINANQAGNATYVAAAQVQQTFTVGPKLVADAYAAIGNTQLVAAGHSAPTTPHTTASGTLLDNDGADVAITLTTATDAATTAGGSITIAADGAFTYTPPTGLATGSDTYVYTATANAITRTATITFNLADIVWYVDSASAAVSHDGRSNTPFLSMGTAANGLGTALSGTGPAAGAFIYVAKGGATTSGAFALKSNQTLIGAGATLSVPAASPALTLPGAAANTPTLTGTLSANSASGIVADGLSMSTGTATAVNLVNTGGAFTFRSISANGGGNGIVLQNTTGSFTVTGDGSNTSQGGNASGGTIANMTGADLATAGSAIYLSNAQNVTLRRMLINGSNQNYGIRGTLVNGFTLEYSTVTGTNGTAATLASPENSGEGSIYFGNTTTNGLASAATFTSNVIAGGRSRNLSIINTLGTTALSFSNNAFGLNQNYSNANQSLAVEAINSGTVVNATAANNTFQGSPGDLANFTGQAGTTMSVVFTGNSLANSHAQNTISGGGMTLATQGSMSFDVTGNSFNGADGSAVTLHKASGGTLLSGHFRNNTIGTAGLSGSGSKNGNGLFWSFAGTGTITLDVSNNQIRQYLGTAGIYADNTAGSYTVNANITGNTIAEPGPAPNTFAGIALTAGAPLSTDAISVCANITGNIVSTGDPSDLNDIIIGGGASGASTIRLPGIASNPSDTDVQSFIFANNNVPGTAVLAYSDAPGGTASTFVGGGACPTPP